MRMGVHTARERPVDGMYVCVRGTGISDLSYYLITSSPNLREFLNLRGTF